MRRFKGGNEIIFTVTDTGDGYVTITHDDGYTYKQHRRSFYEKVHYNYYEEIEC